jgi:hypothetical protein
MTRNNKSKAPTKRGFHKLSFDDAYSEAEKAVEIEEKLSGSLASDDRDRLQAELRAIGNKLTPAFRQYSAPFRSEVRKEAKAWMAQRGGAMPNISEFIRHFQSLPSAERLRKFGKLAATDSAIQKILRDMGIRGKAGRPPGT